MTDSSQRDLDNPVSTVMTPLKTEFYGRIGHTLLQIQLAEQQLRYCIDYFLPAEPGMTLEEIEALAEADRKKTLGDLVAKMRTRIVIDKDFNAKLAKFVEDRNALAHRFLKVDGVSLHSDEGLKKGIEFTKSLTAQANEVRKTIVGLIAAIDDAPKGDDDEKKYKELAKVIFG
jgi:hypothetical protein